MNDKEIMTNILNSVKGECDLLMHGAIESSTPNVHGAFKQSLDDALCMQNKIYEMPEVRQNVLAKEGYKKRKGEVI